MSLFYYDRLIAEYEGLFQWDSALKYLERLYWDCGNVVLLNSLIGYSWYYLVEGPLVSQTYENDPNEIALIIWKKYLDIGAQKATADPFFNFIAGYTLSLHGFLISIEYERKGICFLKSCLNLTEDPMLRELAKNFLMNRKNTRYKPLADGNIICKRFFNGNSLLDKYFNEIYKAADT